MSEREFLRRWDGSFAELVTLTLHATGQERDVLVPIAQNPRAANQLLEHIVANSTASEPNARIIAAMLAGYLGPHAPQNMLDRLFDAECARISNGHDPFKVMAAFQVVDALVVAAARWCRDDRMRPSGLDLCRKIVERTVDRVDSEYWSQAPYALVTLVHHHAPDADALLARFTDFANGEPPDFVTKPTLQGERSCARALAANNLKAIGRVEAMIDASDAQPPFDFSETARAYLDEWIALAKEIG